MSDNVLVCMIARIPAGGVGIFQRYEATVLPLLAHHDGTLERRVCNTDGTIEVHLVRFASQAALDRFRASEERNKAAELLVVSGAITETVIVRDV